MNYGSSADYLLDYGSHYYLGAYSANNFTAARGIKPEDAWNIDTKLDDGKPATGTVIARYWNDSCSRADDGTHANNDYVASYKLTETGIVCTLVFRKIF